MIHSIVQDSLLQTPAFVYDVGKIRQQLQLLSDLRETHGFKILYSIKSASFKELLVAMLDLVDGFAVSSLFEARLASELLCGKGSVHITSPGLPEQQIEQLYANCQYINFNSWPQWQRFRTQTRSGVEYGLRLNPHTNFVKDDRYDPCRTHSKLGISQDYLALRYKENPDEFSGITGLHVHNNCESRNFSELRQTIDLIFERIPGLVKQLKWLNLGGGYLFNQVDDLSGLQGCLSSLQSRTDMGIFLEPGKTIVGEAGYLVASVIDIFESDNKSVAVLDTSVNHIPEVFEYQYQPQVLNTETQGEYHYRLVGTSCLSGDMFGDYSFSEPLELGSRIIFGNVGAYMYVKANMFNGINLPNVYALKGSQIDLIKSHEYEDYLRQLI